MKHCTHYLRYLLLLTAVISVTYSCNKDKGTEFNYFVSKELKVTYSSDYITSLLDNVTPSYPEVTDLLQYFSGGVEVYRIVYKTTVDNKAIEASGLVCIPEGPGEYPVLSFQNGTNTVNAYCPSEFVINPAYQMIEIVASMGYVVVIPDYPGFGQSSDIAHPYLIEEPTTQSIVDMLHAVREMGNTEFPETTIRNEYYIIGYSQGGWATLALDKALETKNQGDFNLKGSACGAGPYNLVSLFEEMMNVVSYPMPVYIGYIVNAYSVYHQFTNPVSDILRQPYDSRLATLYNGNLDSDQINGQLTPVIKDLFTADFLSGFASAPEYSSVRDGLTANSVAAWNTQVPLYLVHGGGDTSVDPSSTENIYQALIGAGTSPQIITKEIIPALDHGEAVVPAMLRGLKFLNDIRIAN